MGYLGGGIDEVSLAAGQLNQGFVGCAFGYQTANGVIYARLAGFEIGTNEVTLWLDGVPAERAELRVGAMSQLVFSNADTLSQMSYTVERIEKLLEKQSR